jgi:hypothetical protein
LYARFGKRRIGRAGSYFMRTSPSRTGTQNIATLTRRIGRYKKTVSVGSVAASQFDPEAAKNLDETN